MLGLPSLQKCACAIFGEIRVFLNLWFAKPMVWVRVAFHENDGNHENDENDEDNSDSYKQGVESWIRGNHGNHENDENHGNSGCKPRVPQTTGLEIPEKFDLEFDFKFEISDGKNLVKFGGRAFLPARRARKISGQISGKISEKISETSFQISRLFSETSFSRRAVPIQCVNLNGRSRPIQSTFSQLSVSLFFRAHA